MTKLFKVIGLMSGTSMDGIDLALIISDGKEIINHIKSDFFPYSDIFRNSIKAIIADNRNLSKVREVEDRLTKFHADFVNKFLIKSNISPNEIDIIAFHGQTIDHRPDQSITWQIGNSKLLSCLTKIKVIGDLRQEDIKNGGQGAPLIAIYHFYLFNKLINKSAAIINIGGVANFTFFEKNQENSLIAGDFCFGNALSDDLVKEISGANFDHDGQLALMGQVDQNLVAEILSEPFFLLKPPKSLDRQHFNRFKESLKKLKTNDALASLAYIIAKSLKINFELINKEVSEIIVCGGGSNNKAIMLNLKNQFSNIKVKKSEDYYIDSSMIEAAGFAYLGVRSILNLPISFPKTTGVNIDSGCVGGVLYDGSCIIPNPIFN